MTQEKSLALAISIGRLIAILGAVMFLYMRFIQNVSPPAEILLLMIAGALIVGIAGLVRWVKTGALK
jgi:hypothetical protein